ncbi:MAG: methyltransferase domain-containing protein [Phycisphaera sp.]|nr:methyltransferase domain-containing protein [Phycisphaera sp.]
MTTTPAIILSQATGLSDRQSREAAYYDQYSRMHAVQAVDLEPAVSDERRPWSPYWSVVGLVREAYQGVPGGQKLLELGCGMGVASCVFAKVGYHVTGVDISDGNLEVARNLAQANGLIKSCTFARSACETLDFPDASFDVVTGIDILHHTDVPRVLREVHRVLKPGGVAIFKEPLGDSWIERVRESKFVLKLLPREESLDEHTHITQDERKLRRDEVQLIRKTFSRVKERRLSLIQRLCRISPERLWGLIGKVQWWDYQLMRCVPMLERWGDIGLFSCRK